MTRHQRIAARAVREHLAGNPRQATVPLFTLACIADKACREAGRKTDLFESLSPYAAVLPPGTRTAWTGNDVGQILCAVNPYSPGRDAVREVRPVAGPFDAAVDFGPDTPPRL